jgi:hypothetical protein
MYRIDGRGDILYISFSPVIRVFAPLEIAYYKEVEKLYGYGAGIIGKEHFTAAAREGLRRRTQRRVQGPRVEGMGRRMNLAEREIGNER